MFPDAPGLLQNPGTRIQPFEVLNVVDYGDAAVDPFSIENSMGPIRELVREVAATGALPFRFRAGCGSQPCAGLGWDQV